LIVRTEFLNNYQHDFTANAICIRSDNVFIDSLALYDDGLHGDSLAGDGIWGGFILPIDEEEIYKVGISTIETQSGNYFYSDDLLRFTTAGPIEVSSLNVTYNSIAKIYEISPSLKNKGHTYTVENVQISMSSDDSTITYISSPLTIPSIPPGDTATASSGFSVRVDSNFSGTFNFNFEITSNSWLYWKDSETYIVTGVEYGHTLPISYRLYQNYPNPFNPSTKIKFEIPELTDVELKIYNVLGSEVLTLVNDTKSVGFYEVDFIATGLPSGIYFYRLRAGDFVETKKMMLMK
jgi:hypothetical protein